MITTGDIKVQSQYKIERLLDMELDIREGNHGKLTLRGRLADGTSTSVTRGTIKVTVGSDGGSDGETLFQGDILESYIFVENGVKQIILSAETSDGKMDRKKRSRSFQDVTMTYDQIMRNILTEYGGTLQCEMPAVKIGKPVIQYEETDWEFIRRLAGSMGTGVFSREDGARPCLTAGLSEGRTAELPPEAYRCGVDEDYYWQWKQQEAGKEEFLYYEVSIGQRYRVGDHAWYKGRKLYIYEVKAVLEREELMFTYKLGGICRFKEMTRPNPRLAGLAVPGRVERTEGESVYLRLDMDGENGKASYPFPWVPVTRNPAYCMPQTGTRAYLYIPDGYGQEALAVGSIRTNSDAPCFGNVQERGLETEHGKLLGMGADTLCLAGGRPTGVQLAVLGTDSLMMQAREGSLLLRAGEGIMVQAPRVTVRTPLAINQNSTGRRNPPTGGPTYISSQYEFSISSPLGELVGMEYEYYNPFGNEISYESYEAVEQRRRDGLVKGIITALAIGAVVAVVVFTGGAALGVALAIGGVVAGVGSLASAATYMQDRKNSTASPPETYINNAKAASLITAAVIASFWAAPYAAQAVTWEVSQGLPLTMLFGHVFTLEELTDWAMIGTQTTALMNAGFQINELLAFFGGTKELGAPTGWEVYDDTKELVEAYSMQLFFMGCAYWLQEKAAGASAGTRGKQGRGTQAGAQVEGGSTPNYKLLNTSSADDVNAIFKETLGYEPPYKPGTTVREIQLTKRTTFVRVYDKINSRMQGGWVIKAEDIAGLTPQEIQNKFALPTTPKYICDVILEAGTKLRTGEANPLFGFEGGGQQYDLMINGKNVGIFENERIIGQ